MSRAALLLSTVLIASLAVLTGGHAQSEDAAVPNLMSPDSGWQPASGLDFLPVEGKIAPIGRLGPARPGIERMSDDQNANLTAWAAAKMRARNEEVRNGHRAFTAQSRCWPGGGPGQLVFVAEPIYFIQTPREVWIVWERDHLVRRVYLDREHSADPKPSWFGESVGRYENGELVVDTIGFLEHEYSVLDNYATPHTKDMHVVERWKIVDGGNMLEVTVTVEDPGAFKAPWTGKVQWRKVNRRLAEWVCAENNLGYEGFFKLEEYPMPVATKPDF
jgi:hypothetical protein